MKTTHSILAAALLAAGATAVASQPAAAGYRWDPACGCQRPIAYVAPQPYLPAPEVITVYRPRVVYRPQVVYEAVPAYVVRERPAYVHGCGCEPRAVLSGSLGYGYYRPGYGYRADWGYGPTD
jgi:hypothetical protein